MSFSLTSVGAPGSPSPRRAGSGPGLPVLLLALLTLFLAACGTPPISEPPTAHEPGQLVELKDQFGTFYAYVPTTIPDQPQVLAVIHGTPPKDGTAEWNAEFYAASWTEFAEERGLILIAPAFNQEDFSSRYGDQALSGYRGLFGREIGADDWLLRLVRAHQAAFGSPDEPFYLYGHSAGGQFTARFLVRHPEAVKRAVISSAATYPQPDPGIAWPFGLGELHEEIQWSAETSHSVDIVPDEQTWLAASQVPLTVIVGLNDTGEIRADLIPGQKGKNRLTIARNWIKDMTAFAQENGRESRFKLEMIPAKGHSMGGLLPYSQAALDSEDGRSWTVTHTAAPILPIPCPSPVPAVQRMSRSPCRWTRPPPSDELMYEPITIADQHGGSL